VVAADTPPSRASSIARASVDNFNQTGTIMIKSSFAAGFVTIASLSLAAEAQANVATANSVVAEWNALATACTATNRAGPVQVLDLAVVQAAVHNAVQAIERRYEAYLAPVAATGNESTTAAAASAAYNVLAVICPTSLATLDAAFKPWKDGLDPGLAVGAAAAAAMLAEVRPAPVVPPFTGGTGIGEWQPQAPATSMAFLYLATTKPFTIQSPSQFRAPPPPALNSEVYIRDYEEVKRVGDVKFHTRGAMCPAPRETEVGRFWSGNVVSQWNETVRNIVVDRQLDIGESARLLALANLAAADALITVWDSKRFYNFWRPYGAIRTDDGVPETVTDPTWTPFIQSAYFPAGSQTPAYPDYTSGANGFTSAVVTTLQLFFRGDWLRFEINKVTSPVVAICTNPRVYRRFSEAMDEVVDARIYLGIHFRFADEEARRQGTQVAYWTFSRYLRPYESDVPLLYDHQDPAPASASAPALGEVR
jgi:hypothetical protein